MAKKLGKRAGKKGFDTRDYLVIGGYVIFALWLVYLATTGREKNRLIKRQSSQITALEKERSTVNRKVKKMAKELSEEKARVENSAAKLKREKQEYDFVVGTSLEYAKKNKLLMAIWEAIDKVRNVAIRDVTVEKNDVTLTMVTRSDVYLTEFMTELNKRKDLISTIRIKENKVEKLSKKSDQELLVGLLKIIAKRNDPSAGRGLGSKGDG
jgi:hypothetical protein